MEKDLPTTSAVDGANALIATPFISSVSPLLIPKIPVQERGKLKFNMIVEVAEELVLEMGVDDVSPYKIAEKAAVPAASVYQYFPSIGALFAVMAEKHFMPVFSIAQNLLDEAEIRTWKDIASNIVDGTYEFYTSDELRQVLFLGTFVTPGVNEYAASRLGRIVEWTIKHFHLLYKKSDLEALPEKLSICIQIIETIYRRSLAIHGKVTESYREESRTIVLSYLGEYFASFTDK